MQSTYRNEQKTPETYTTPEGVQLLKEWPPHLWQSYERAAVKAAARVRNICEFLHGCKGRNACEAFGLPYTSSSAFAAIWNTNSEAHDPRGRFFRGVAIDPAGVPVLMWEKYDNGNEIEIFEPFAAFLLWEALR